MAKRRGGHRLIERPKDALKSIQRQILHRILEHIPPHDAVHSYRTGRSIVTYAQPHCAKPLLLRLDIAEFFPSSHVGRERAQFPTAGYPDAVKELKNCPSRSLKSNGQLPRSRGFFLKNLSNLIISSEIRN